MSGTISIVFSETIVADTSIGVTGLLFLWGSERKCAASEVLASESISDQPNKLLLTIFSAMAWAVG
jgi:hypothetical protein